MPLLRTNGFAQHFSLLSSEGKVVWATLILDASLVFGRFHLRRSNIEERDVTHSARVELPSYLQKAIARRHRLGLPSMHVSKPSKLAAWHVCLPSFLIPTPR